MGWGSGERRVEVVVKIQKKIGVGGGGCRGWREGREAPVGGSQGGSERRIEVIVKMQKKSLGVGDGVGLSKGRGLVGR